MTTIPADDAQSFKTDKYGTVEHSLSTGNDPDDWAAQCAIRFNWDSAKLIDDEGIRDLCTRFNAETASRFNLCAGFDGVSLTVTKSLLGPGIRPFTQEEYRQVVEAMESVMS